MVPVGVRQHAGRGGADARDLCGLLVDLVYCLRGVPSLGQVVAVGPAAPAELWAGDAAGA